LSIWVLRFTLHDLALSLADCFYHAWCDTQVVLGYLNDWPHGIVLLLANAMGAATATHEGAGQSVGQFHEVVDLLEAGMRQPAAAYFTQEDEWKAACREALLKLSACTESQSSQDCLEV
jgi:hypothetical protein